MSSAIIYSELLSNIRQISVLAELLTPSDNSTEVFLSSDRKYLSLVHQGETTKLELPGDVNPAYTPQQPAAGLKQISWRIPLTPQPPQARPEFAESASAPWSANDLDSSSGFACRACSADVVPAGTIKTWQDLPSANWAEMMDFWHCHKPDVPKLEQNGMESGLVEKGYGASASFRAQKGMGKVDLMTFLLSKDDCGVSMVRLHPALHYSPITYHSLFSSCSLLSRVSRRRPRPCLSQFSGLVTDTTTQKRYPKSIARSQRSFLEDPLLTEHGLLEGFWTFEFHHIFP